MKRILISGVNWIGDTIMSMPAIQTFRAANPEAHISMLVKPKMVPLWQMHSAPDEILELHSGLMGSRKTAATVRAGNFDVAYILPHSFRSAAIPCLARVPKRIGMHGHFRDGMLTRVRPLGRDFALRHQAYEYFHLLELALPDRLPEPQLTIPVETLSWARHRLAAMPAPYTVLIPGAARGPSKQWPAGHYARLGRLLVENTKTGTILVMGSPGETELCEQVARDIGKRAASLAGQTNLQQWAAIMSCCDLVVANDSGGMHIASAVGTRVTAIYGITDPTKTGPIGPRSRVIQKGSVRQRNIPRDSEQARLQLLAITPEEVYQVISEQKPPREAS